MDLERRAQKQSLRVIVSELVMVVAVIMMVAVLALIVSGYWLGSDFKVERQGMLQISSVPTGASVEVDGESPWFQHTNTSKILSSGEHTVTLSKENYDSWSKIISINEGLLYKLNYPRLFLKERTKEAVYDFTSTIFATVSPNRKLLLTINNTTKWSLTNLDSTEIKPTNMDVEALFYTSNLANGTRVLDCEIISANWDEANEHVLFEANINQTRQWFLLNVKNPSKSVNLTREFAQPFSTVSIFNHSANVLLAVSNGNLHKIDLDSMQLSSVIASSIDSYDIYDSDILVSSNKKVCIIRSANSDPECIKETEGPTKVLFGKFYDDRYIIVIEGNQLTIVKKDDEVFFDGSIGFIPETIKMGPGAEFVFMDRGNDFATFDMESMKLSEWSSGASHFGWLDGYMLYAIKDGVLSVYDYDGLNHRALSSNVSERLPVTITNDKWLYYFSDGNLIREWLIAQ